MVAKPSEPNIGQGYIYIYMFKYLFILVAPGLSYGMRDVLVAACIQDLVPRPGIQPRPSALGAHSLTHWTTREVP